MAPPVRFAVSQEDVRIAWAAHGSGPVLVFVRGWLSHLDLMWADEAFRGFFEALGRRFTVVRYDGRGCGLSDRAPVTVNLDALVADLDCVVELTGGEPVVLYAQCYGGPVALTYAARRPERVARMIIENSYACGAQLTAPERRMRILDTLRDLPEAGLQLLASYTHPEPTRRRFGSGGDIHRSVSPADALRLYALGFELDVSDRLVDVRTPTLVLHRLDRPMIPVRCGRDLAAALPDARFVGLPGTALNGWEEHPEAGLVAMAEFLGVPLSLSAFDQAERTLRTILFTDVVGSTELTQRLGDVQAREVMRTHDRLLRQALAGHGGREIKHTGDGLLATFDSVSRALDCTIAMQRLLSGPDAPAVAPPLRIRVGLNAGEPENVGDDVFGTAVQLAARICARAGPGEVLLSDATRQLVAGKGYRFVDAGDVELKGFTGSLRLHALIWDPH